MGRSWRRAGSYQVTKSAVCEVSPGRPADRSKASTSAAAESWVIARSDEQQGGGVGAGPVEAEQLRRADGDQRGDQVIQPLDLRAGELHAPAELAQRDADRVASRVAGAGPQCGYPGGQGCGPVPGEPGPQLVRAGQDQGAGLVNRLGPLVAGTAPGDHERPDRLHRAVAAPGLARRPARQGSTGGADRVQRVNRSDLPLRCRSCRSARSASTTRTPRLARYRVRPAP